MLLAEVSSGDQKEASERQGLEGHCKDFGF